MTCKICSNTSKRIFNQKILNKYYVDFFKCDFCEFIQTEDPHWIKEAYEQSINISDTGYLHRNILFSKIVSVLIYFSFNRESKFLDFGSGYGVFPRLMRDIGFDFYWDDKYTQNLFLKSFEYDFKESIEIVTAFECFEHFINPVMELESMLEISSNIIFSTETIPTPDLIDKNWHYFEFEHGQHIAFYSKKTLQHLAAKFNLNYYNLKGLHIFSKKNLSVFNLFLIKLTRFGLFSYVKRKLKSKTHQDYLNLKKHHENFI